MTVKLYSALLIGLLLLTGCGREQWLDHQEKPVGRADLDGQWMVVNYWAEWCAPCRDELPEFNRLEHDNADITVLGVNYDGISGEQLVELVEKMNIQFSVMGQDFVDSFNLDRPEVLPTTYIFNPEGDLVHSLPGPQTEQALLKLLGR